MEKISKQSKIIPFICMILSFLSLKFVSLIMHTAHGILNIPVDNTKPMYQLISGILVFFIASIINYSLLKKEFKELKTTKEKLKKVVLGIIILFIIKYMVAFVTTIIYIFIGGNIQSNNQALVEQMAHANPILSLITGTLLAPFYEELIFRGSIRQFFKSDFLFITISGLVFGLLHVVKNNFFLIALLLFFATLELFRENKKKRVLYSIISFVVITGLFLSLAFINKSYISLGIDIKSLIIQGPLYIVLGGYLAFYYVKNKNIYLNMLVHAGNNFISELMVLF